MAVSKQLHCLQNLLVRKKTLLNFDSPPKDDGIRISFDIIE